MLFILNDSIRRPNLNNCISVAGIVGFFIKRKSVIKFALLSVWNSNLIQNKFFNVSPIDNKKI